MEIVSGTRSAPKGVRQAGELCRWHQITYNEYPSEHVDRRVLAHVGIMLHGFMAFSHRLQAVSDDFITSSCSSYSSGKRGDDFRFLVSF